MALNPYFLQGSQAEQRLVQDLVNEQLKIYGVEVTYIPRKYVNQQSIIEEVQSSKFDDILISLLTSSRLPLFNLISSVIDFLI